MDEDGPLYVKSELNRQSLARAVGRYHCIPQGAHPLAHPVGIWPESPLAPSKYSPLAALSLVSIKKKPMAMAPKDIV